MRKLKLYIAQSLDGYIATKEDGLDWLNDVNPAELTSDFGYHDFFESIETTLMGYNTYKEILGFGMKFPYMEKENFVFSRQHRKQDDNPVKFIMTDIVPFVKELKTKEGKDIWLIGGGQINRELLNANLIDELIISIKPVILGEGIPMFADGTEFKKFTIVETNEYDKSLTQIRMLKKD